MVKKKRLYHYCKLCDKRIVIEIPVDAAENRQYYPFEYIEVHGNPQHALLLFIDRHLAIRDSIAYKDIRIAKKKKDEYQSLKLMSETDAFAAIYNNPKCLKVYRSLTEGPKESAALLDYLRETDDVRDEEFNLLMLPLIRSGLVRSEWLKSTINEVYYLYKDFTVIRIPSSVYQYILTKMPKYKSDLKIYTKKLKEILTEYREKFLNDPEEQIEEIKRCLKYRNQYKYSKIFYELRKGPLTTECFTTFDEKMKLAELVRDGFVFERKIKSKTYYILLTDIKVVKFIPKYMVKILHEQFAKKNITKEMIEKHLELLYESDAVPKR